MILYVLPLMFFAVTTSLNNPAGLVRSSLLACLPLLILLRRPINFKDYKFVSSLFLIIIISYTISWQINTQSLGNYLFGAYNRNLGILSLVGLYLLTLLSADFFSQYLDKFIKMLYVLNVISCVYGLLQLMGRDPIRWEKGAGFGLTLGNPNFSSAWLAMLSVVPLHYLILWKRPYRYYHFALYSLTFVLILLSGASQGFIIFVFNASIYLSLKFNLFSKFKGVKLQHVLLGLSSLIASGIFLVQNRAFFHLLDSQLQITHRLEHWKMGYRIFIDHFLFGVGIENIGRFSGEYRGEAIRSWGQFTHPDKIHNSFIDNYVTGGIFVGTAWIVFVLFSFFVIYKLLKLDNLGPKINIIYILISVWTSYLLQTIFSTDHNILATYGMMTVGTLLGIYVNNLPTLNRSNFVKKNR